MNDEVYIRPLELKDALVSYKWRNNPRIWRLTGSRPNTFVTPEIETEWLKHVLEREDERRFAICLASDDRYIGNIYLTNITDKRATLHVFIGEMEYWGGGRALGAVSHVLSVAFTQLKLDIIVAEINHRNLASISLGKSTGFKQSREFFNEQHNEKFVEMYYTKEMYEQERTLNY